jgi:heme-degrading monooxygenase HmoA
METTTDTGVYTSGDWHVRAGSEDAFVSRWREFLEYARAEAPGFVWARLLRDANDARHFVSVGEWQSLAAQSTWRGLPDFAAKFGACHALCDEDRNSNYTQAAKVL